MECQPSREATGLKTRVPLTFEEYTAGIILGLLALITFANVAVRYLTDFSFAFTEEISIFLMVMVALLGGSSVMAKGGHLNIMFLVDKLSPARKKLAVCASNALSALMFLLLAIYGARMAWDEYRFEVTSPGLGIPTWIYTIWLPILALAICGRALGLMIRSWREGN